MITPYPPPPGPRVELLRVRRVDASTPNDRTGPSPRHDQGDLALSQPQRLEPVDNSDEALRLLARDLHLQASEDPS